MDTADNYHDEETNPLALLRLISHNCEAVMSGSMEAESACEAIHHAIEHFAANTNMRLSMESPEEEEYDDDKPF